MTWTYLGLRRHLETFRGRPLPTSFHMALVTSATSPTEDTAFLGDVQEIADGNGYTAGGQAFSPGFLGFPGLSEGQLPDTNSVVTLRDFSWVADNGPLPSIGDGARYMLMVDNNPSIANREVWAWWDLQDVRSVSAGRTLLVNEISLELFPEGTGTPPVNPPMVDMSIVPEDRRTIWDPGIYGGIPADNIVLGEFPGDIGPASQHGVALSPSGGDDRAAIQAALTAAGQVASPTSRQVVKLNAGTFRIPGNLPLQIPSYVILRGTLSGTTRQTIIDQQFAPSQGEYREMINLTGGFTSWTTPVNCVGVQQKGSSTIAVADASGFSVGDIIAIDQTSDGSMWGTPGSGTWPGGPINPTFGDFVRPTDAPTGRFVAWVTSLFYHRQPYPSMGTSGIEGSYPNSATWRHITQRCEILSIKDNILTIHDPNASNGRVGNPLHTTFFVKNNPQVYRVCGAGNDVARYAGLEDIKLQARGLNGQRIVQFQRSYCCWAKNVETDGATNEWSGRHMQLYPHTVRCQIEGCYVHESDNYSQGANAYGINIAGSNNLVANNVAWQLNKPIVLEGSCGGNVIAYNYADDAVIISVNNSQQESAISTHGSFCFFDLFEGNYTPNVTVDSTHGNNDKEMIFRNYCTGRNQNGFASGYERAISVDGWNWDVTSIGNVLWDPVNAAQINAVFSGRNDPLFNGPEWVYLIGSNAWNVETQDKPGAQQLDDGMALENFIAHMDYNPRDDAVLMDPSNPVTELPPSLYLTEKPAFFGALEWPWVDPEGADHAARVKTLPAQARWVAGQA